LFFWFLGSLAGFSIFFVFFHLFDAPVKYLPFTYDSLRVSYSLVVSSLNWLSIFLRTSFLILELFEYPFFLISFFAYKKTTWTGIEYSHNSFVLDLILLSSSIKLSKASSESFDNSLFSLKNYVSFFKSTNNIKNKFKKITIEKMNTILLFHVWIFNSCYLIHDSFY
jgi:hypothetical protein